MDAAGYAAGASMALLAAVRRGKAVHPHGAVHEATVVFDREQNAPLGADLLRRPGEHRALVRFSRSIGLPRPLPDLLGMSIRLPDAHGPGRHQDFMLVSSVDAPVLHHGFVPATDVSQRPYSSSLPYRSGDEQFLVGALPDPRSPRPDGDTELDRLQRAADTGRLRFHLAVAPVLGRFRPVAEIRIGRRMPAELDAIQMNPFNCGGGIEPAGFLNRLRDYAYPMSQAAWASRRSTSADGSAIERWAA